MGEGSFFSKIFGLNKEEERKENSQQVNTTKPNEQEPTLQDIIKFVSELQSYYYNDICKIQTEVLTKDGISKEEEQFLKKKVVQESIAMNQIDEILREVIKCEREYQSIWGKSVYSFYNEIEKEKLKEVQEKVFRIIIKLNQVNVKEELENVIPDRLEYYRRSWNLPEDIIIPTNTSLILLSRENQEETYKFGRFRKIVYAKDKIQYKFSSEQLKAINNIKVNINFESLSEEILVYCSSVTRVQLNSMKRTSIFFNDWEKVVEEKKNAYVFDIVKVSELEEYLKGILQLLLLRKTYVVISIINPNDYMLKLLKDRIKLNQNEGKVTIKGLKFILDERSGSYKDNLQVVRVDRRNIPNKLEFTPFIEFKKTYFWNKKANSVKAICLFICV